MGTQKSVAIEAMQIRQQGEERKNFLLDKDPQTSKGCKVARPGSF